MGSAAAGRRSCAPPSPTPPPASGARPPTRAVHRVTRRRADRGVARRRHRAQRDHGLDRPAAHPRRAARRPPPGPGQQGVAHRRRGPREGGRPPGPARAGGLRALRARAGAARGYGGRGPPPRAHGLGRAVPRPGPRRPARRHARPGPRPPHVGHGPRRHHQLRLPREQGPRGDRGPPAVRRAPGPDRRRGPPAVRGPFDGRVRRRVHARPGLPAGHASAHRPGAVLAAPGPGRGPGLRLDAGSHLDLRAPRRGGLPRRAGREGGGGRLAHPHGRVQRRQRGGGGRLPRRRPALRRDRGHGPRHRRRLRPRGRARRGRPRPAPAALTVDAVLAAEAWARRAARARW